MPSRNPMGRIGTPERVVLSFFWQARGSVLLAANNLIIDGAFAQASNSDRTIIKNRYLDRAGGAASASDRARDQTRLVNRRPHS
jgi:hypothetical protein